MQVISVRPEATVRVSKQSDVAILSCLATGNPSPVLVWAKNGREFFYASSQDTDRIFIEVSLGLLRQPKRVRRKLLHALVCTSAKGLGQKNLP